MCVYMTWLDKRWSINWTISVLLAFLEWCGKNTKITIPTVAMTTMDCAAKTVAMPSRVRASCKAPKRYGNLSFIFFLCINGEKNTQAHTFIKCLVHYSPLCPTRQRFECDPIIINNNRIIRIRSKFETRRHV